MRTTIATLIACLVLCHAYHLRWEALILRYLRDIQRVQAQQTAAPKAVPVEMEFDRVVDTMGRTITVPCGVTY